MTHDSGSELQPPTASPPSLRQGAARVQRAIRQGRPRAQVAAELMAAGLTQAQVEEALALGTQAERRSINNLMVGAVVVGGIGVVMMGAGVIIGLSEANGLFGVGFGVAVGVALPAFIYGIVRLTRMS